MIKNQKIGLGVLALIILCLAAWLALKPSKLDVQTNIINSKSSGLTAEEDQFVQAKKIKAEELVKNLNPSSTAKDKYGAYTELGAQEYLLGNLLAAKNNFLLALDANYNNIGALNNLFQTEITMNDFVSAKAHIQQALAIDSTLGPLWIRYINFEKEQLKAGSTAVENLYKEALGKTNSNTEVMVGYAQFLETLNRNQEALEILKQVIAMDPEHKAQYQSEIDIINKKITDEKR